MAIRQRVHLHHRDPHQHTPLWPTAQSISRPTKQSTRPMLHVQAPLHKSHAATRNNQSPMGSAESPADSPAIRDTQSLFFFAFTHIQSEVVSFLCAFQAAVALAERYHTTTKPAELRTGQRWLLPAAQIEPVARCMFSRTDEEYTPVNHQKLKW